METTELISNSPPPRILGVKERLALLREWASEWLKEDKRLENELLHLSDNKHDIQRGVQLIHLRKAALYRIIKEPLFLDFEAIATFGYGNYHQQLINQYVNMSSEEKILWLNNLLFILTPSLKELDDKVNSLLDFKSFGQGRNLLLSGLGGTGKSTYLFWRASLVPPEIKKDVNDIPIVIIQCPVNNKSSLYLFRRIIASLGKTYLANDNDEDLFDKTCVFLQACGVKLLILDEISHLQKPELRRRILELSNTIDLRIIGSAVSPEKFVEGDIEIAGRFNDILPLKLYSGNDLSVLLAIINLILPFSQSSELFATTIVENGVEKEGPAQFIYRVTRGILRDIMRIIYDASILALKLNKPNISMDELEIAWTSIQHKPLKTLHEGIENLIRSEADV